MEREYLIFGLLATVYCLLSTGYCLLATKRNVPLQLRLVKPIFGRLLGY